MKLKSDDDDDRIPTINLGQFLNYVRRRRRDFAVKWSFQTLEIDTQVSAPSIPNPHNVHFYLGNTNIVIKY